MAIQIGQQLGSLEITALLGKGGMGEVYKARDTKLKRDVAIKVLPDEFARDAERLARAQREAEVLASLNHPHIAQIYGQQAADGMPCLILEYVDGETLEERLKQGPIPVSEALELARQIADALEAAHERGIVHRDLKPANVKVTSAGKLKVLDFGLAKAFESVPAAALSHSPTIVAGATGAGVIMGTSAYMSPEQARAKSTDSRSDIWAFGVVLYEMLSGKPAFPGDTVMEILGGVLKIDPDWTALPAATPPAIVSLLRHCLQKDPNRRLRHIADARFQIEQALHEPGRLAEVSQPVRKSGEWLWKAAAIIAIAAAGSIAAWHFTNAIAPPPETRLQIITPPAVSLGSFAISPDGRKLVFEAIANGKDLLWLRRFESDAAEPLPGTDGPTQPFWSADSKSIGFFADGKLKRIDIAGGAPQVLTDAPNSPSGTWNVAGTILFALQATGPLQRVSANGGAVEPTTSVDPPRQVSHRFPRFLPDGRHFLFGASGTPEGHGVYIGSLDNKLTKRLFDADSAASFMPPDQLFFVRQGTLFAQKLDLKKFEMPADPAPIAASVFYAMDWNLEPAFSISQAGAFAYRSGKRERELIWLDRAGRQVGTVGQRDDAQPVSMQLSPDGRTVLVTRQVNGNMDIWLMDIARAVLRRLTTDPADDNWPIWSPDASYVTYSSRKKRGNMNIFHKPVNGSADEEMLVESPENTTGMDWSPNGRFLLYNIQNAKTGYDISALSLDEKKSVPVAESSADEFNAKFSPDGHWIAFQSNETGRNEIYVQPFPGTGGKSSPISVNGGTFPQWRGDGKEIFYLGLDNRLMAVPIALGPNGRVDAGTPVALFPTRPGSEYAASRDGQRFLINTFTEEAAASPITVVLNWSGRK